MDKSLIELTDERGIEYYLVPHLGNRKIQTESDTFVDFTAYDPFSERTI